jgi:glycosyltransferase involved in cell wall biosynthesis
MSPAVSERRPARVLMTADAVGGVWQYSLELAGGFATRGIAPVLAVLGPVPDATQRLEAAALPALRLIPTQLPLEWTATAPESLHASAEFLAELALSCSADSVHLHTPALVGAAAWPAPVVAVAHSCVATWWRAVRGSAALPRDFAWRADAVADGLVRADAVIAPSRSFAALLQHVYRVDRPIAVVHNGRGVPRFRPVDRRRAVLTAGRLWDEGKNIAVLDRAAARLDAPVYAAGPLRGPNGAGIRLSHLHALGPLDTPQLAAEYASIQVFAAPSLYEPFGLSVLEAAQAGMALVLADIPTFRELWDGAALFVDPTDAGAWAAAFSALLDDAEACARLVAAAHTRAGDYATDAMVRATIAVHDSAIAVRSPRVPALAP